MLVALAHFHGRRRLWIHNYDCQKNLDPITDVPDLALFGGTKTSSEIPMVAMRYSRVFLVSAHRGRGRKKIICSLYVTMQINACMCVCMRVHECACASVCACI